MRQTKLLTIIAIATAGLLVAQKVGAQSRTNINAPRGLAQISALENTASGKMALARNLTITGAIQDGSAQQAILLSFSEQQQLALRDAFITDGNAYELTDGLGTELENVYRSLTTYEILQDVKKPQWVCSPGLAGIAGAGGVRPLGYANTE
jgi:hypothetical protein